MSEPGLDRRSLLAAGATIGGGAMSSARRRRPLPRWRRRSHGISGASTVGRPITPWRSLAQRRFAPLAAA